MYKLSNFDIGMALQSGLMLQNNPNLSFIDKFGPMAIQAALPYMKNKKSWNFWYSSKFN